MPIPESAVVHPLVLLSVVDHYNRVARQVNHTIANNRGSQMLAMNLFDWTQKLKVPNAVPRSEDAAAVD